MRTAVVRVDVDPSALLAPAQLRDGMTALVQSAAELGIQVVDADLSLMPASRRQVEVLIAGEDPEQLKDIAVGLCITAFGRFGARPSAGVLTYVSRGTDDDAHGVLAGLGLRGEIERVPTEDGWDIVKVTLLKSDLQRIPESRVHTALEASLNCEVQIVAVD
ncbi:hypothetical protein [Mycolicibacterium hippocampi]|uniref:Uncharacterized protein n=1 Tax=Mycolicibacterium hippocampi TaxID=659824 RepID=A0A7I9ZUF6_9MYCO|nr:hypothetical protein [Mycolicibacterium hippocampi]GFH04308.1 hypothetical protein MHIP_47910 [Mycolicibacterium hippocampi]